ncbi:MAG: tRNA 2-thiouridine(34) synthase MnmA, partial [Clostridia bacterium]|nr:tRNA 2-thiouridine(34) synthase MnmA [Clostridia bacterium]
MAEVFCLARITVGISGGVDSAVAALLLKAQGHEVTGVFMRNWREQQGKCPALEDFDDARRACEHIGIPCYGTDFSVEFRSVVFAHFLKELQAGRTPNPDVLCNTHIKF